MVAENDDYKAKQLRLREMPEDVYSILLKEQAEQKQKCKCQFSLEQTIYKLIRKATRHEDNRQ